MTSPTMPHRLYIENTSAKEELDIETLQVFDTNLDNLREDMETYYDDVDLHVYKLVAKVKISTTRRITETPIKKPRKAKS